MKTGILAAIFFACVFTPNVHAYYDPSVGRWASRDPVEEDGGVNLYATVYNDPINSVDEFGLKTITIHFGFDSSARANTRTIQIAQKGAAFLGEMLLKCAQKSSCDCPGIGDSIAVSTAYDYNVQNKPAPANRVYNMDTTAGLNLAISNIGNVAGGIGDYRCLITRSKITETWEGTLYEDRAITEDAPPLGTLYNVNKAADYVIAHEMGHFVLYVGDAKDGKHSKDPGNLMYIYGGDTPDCQWCQKIRSLAK